MTPAVYVEHLMKTYYVAEREAGLGAALRSLFKRRTRAVQAVDDISFSIGRGEIVGFLGPNGAGKTTTLKMLAGLLYPTAGVGQVLGHIPFRRERDFLKRITLVMGQRNQLVWDLPVNESFELNRAIYHIPADEYRRAVAELTDLLELGPLLPKPVRNLSLGERMKCEIAAALLHQPQVLFLDEPTIGLDVSAQRRIRAFIREYNRRHGATVMLTSHYMADVEALAERVIVIHHGKLLFDGQLAELVRRFSPHKTIILEAADEGIDLSAYGTVVAKEGARVTLRVAKEDTARVTARLLGDLAISDLTVEDPPVDEVIEQVFSQPQAMSAPTEVYAL